MPKLIISLFTEFDPANPKFLLPLGPPNPRLVGGSATDRNIIFRAVVANLDAEPFSGDAELVASIGGKAAVSWPVTLSIVAGGVMAFQGLSAGSRGGLCVLDTAGLPDGPAGLHIALKVAGEIVAECTMPLRIAGFDLYADGPERPGPADGGGVVIEGNASGPIAAEIKANDVKVAALTTEIAALNKQIPLKQASVDALVARTKGLKAVPSIPNEVAPPVVVPAARK